jgi:hypothetical protein
MLEKAELTDKDRKFVEGLQLKASDESDNPDI